MKDTRSIVGRKPLCCKTILCLCGAGLYTPGYAQSTAPSSITPQTLRPDTKSNEAPIAVPQSNGLSVPSGAEGILVTLAFVDVQGEYIEVAEQTAAIANTLQNRKVTLEEIYSAASEIEAIHARAGFILVRAAIPPQKLVDGGVLKIIVVDGFIESVDTSGLPGSLRKIVAARTAYLVGKQHIKLAALEQPILLAGEVPGLTMTSTLERGTQPGGAKLILTGQHKLISGSVGGDNFLAPSLGRYGINAQVSINSAFGLGEQIYGFASSDADLINVFSNNNTVRVLGGGFVLPFGDGRLSVNPEITFARTQPQSQVGVPQTLGSLKRISLRGTHTFYKTRSLNVAFNAAIEHIEESNNAPLFNVRISQDRYTVARVGFSINSIEQNGNYKSIFGQISQGIGGIPNSADLTTGSGFSRLASNNEFTKFNFTFRSANSIPKKWQLSLIIKGQTTFGTAVFRSEQSAFEGSDAISAFVGGVAAIDEGGLVRIEMERPFYMATAAKLQVIPYGFIASGYGRLNAPTALEKSTLRAAAFGAGVRVTASKIGIGKLGLVMGLEYAHGLSNFLATANINRLNATIRLHF